MLERIVENFIPSRVTIHRRSTIQGLVHQRRSLLQWVVEGVDPMVSGKSSSSRCIPSYTDAPPVLAPTTSGFGYFVSTGG